MKSRKMWAPEGWENDGETNSDADLRTFSKYRSMWRNPFEVEITEIQGRPDFEVGDEVRSLEGREGEVVHPPIWARNAWVVPVWNSREGYRCIYANALTKLPREEALTLRFSGSKLGLNNVLVEAEKEATRMNVRVERVEDDDE